MQFLAKIVILLAWMPAVFAKLYWTLDAYHPLMGDKSVPISAANGRLYFNLPKQNATCKDNKKMNIANFDLTGNQLFLYSDSKAKQQLGAYSNDQGEVRYFTNNASVPAGLVTTKWIQNSEAPILYLNYKEFLSCPNGPNGSWTLWQNIGIEEPAGNEDCVKVRVFMKAIQLERQIPCKYTEE